MEQQNDESRWEHTIGDALKLFDWEMQNGYRIAKMAHMVNSVWFEKKKGGASKKEGGGGISFSVSVKESGGREAGR